MSDPKHAAPDPASDGIDTETGRPDPASGESSIGSADPADTQTVGNAGAEDAEAGNDAAEGR